MTSFFSSQKGNEDWSEENWFSTIFIFSYIKLSSWHGKTVAYISKYFSPYFSAPIPKLLSPSKIAVKLKWCVTRPYFSVLSNENSHFKFHQFYYFSVAIFNICSFNLWIFSLKFDHIHTIREIVFIAFPLYFAFIIHHCPTKSKSV